VLTISLTHFVDFDSKAGTPKLTVLENVKEQLAEPYDAATDFYKFTRDAIVETHRSAQDKTALDALLSGLLDKKNQTARRQGTQEAPNNGNVVWFEPARDERTHAGLDLSVNAELGLAINATRSSSTSRPTSWPSCVWTSRRSSRSWRWGPVREPEC
jgi:hypothetical protein